MDVKASPICNYVYVKANIQNFTKLMTSAIMHFFFWFSELLSRETWESAFNQCTPDLYEGMEDSLSIHWQEHQRKGTVLFFQSLRK
jgi:hypothetical protein